MSSRYLVTLKITQIEDRQKHKHLFTAQATDNTFLCAYRRCTGN